MNESAAFTATALVRLPERDQGILQAIARVHNSRIDAAKKDRSRFYRRDAVVLRNSATGATVLRFMLGAGAGVKGLVREAIAVDYDAFDALGIDYRKSADVEVVARRATWLEVYAHFISHPDPGYRTATQLGVLGAVMGAVGLLISVMQLFL